MYNAGLNDYEIQPRLLKSTSMFI